MSIQYHIYANDFHGGPVSYAAPIGTTASLSFDSPALPAGADATFLVRAFDTVSGLEEQNGDARIRILLDASGADITTLPNSPSGLTAIPAVGGTAKVSWLYNAGGQGGRPSGFHVYSGVGSPNYATPVAVVAFMAGSIGHHYAATLTGLSDGVVYAVAVRSFNATGEESNLVTFLFTALASGPGAVVSLSATVGP